MTKKTFINSDYIFSFDYFGFQVVGVKVSSLDYKYNMLVMGRKRVDLVHKRHGYKSMRGALAGGRRWVLSQRVGQLPLFSFDAEGLALSSGHKGTE